MTPSCYFAEQAEKLVHEQVSTPESAPNPAKDNPSVISLYEQLKSMDCKGCGVGLQMADPYKEGYVDHGHVTKYFENKLALTGKGDDGIKADLQRYIEAYKFDPAQHKDEKDQSSINMDPIQNRKEISEFDKSEKKFFERFWKNVSVKSLACLRCAKLKQNNINQLTKAEFEYARWLISCREREAYC